MESTDPGFSHAPHDVESCLSRAACARRAAVSGTRRRLARTLRSTCLGLLFCLPAIYAGSGNAQIYRCDAGDGVSYADRPCSRGDQSIVRATPGPPVEQMAAARAQLRNALDGRAAKTARAPDRTAAEACPEAVEIVLLVDGRSPARVPTASSRALSR